MIVVCIEGFAPEGFNTQTRKMQHRPNVPVKGGIYEVVDTFYWLGQLYYVLFEFSKDDAWIHDHFREIDININEVFEEEHNHATT